MADEEQQPPTDAAAEEAPVETEENTTTEANQETVGDIGEDKPEETADEAADENVEENAKEESKEATEEEGKETAQEESKETAEEEGKETAEGEAKETAEEESEETAENNAEETAENNAEETAENNAEETAENNAEETAEEKADDAIDADQEGAEESAGEAPEVSQAKQPNAEATEVRQDPPSSPVPSQLPAAAEIPRAPTLPEERAKREAAAAAAAASAEAGDAEDEDESLSALKPVWAFGMNRHVPVITLGAGERDVVFYACANSAVLYDVNTNRQKILRGHTNAITCTAASNDKRWLVTGDAGNDSAVIIWDSRTAVPVRTMFEPHPNGVYAVALNPNSRFLCTLSAEANQTFAIWNWTTGDELSLCSATLSSAYGIQRYISFNADDNSHVATNSDHQVLFFQWSEGKVEYYAPPLTDKDFNKPVGRYCNSVFLRKSTKAISATSQGLCVVWDSNKPLTKMSTDSTPDKRAVKLVPLHERGITVLTQTDEIIVTGDTAGHVKFFDQNLQLLYWYQHFKFGPISSISFKHNSLPAMTGAKDDDGLSLKSQATMDPLYDTDATIPANPFFVRDFVIGTANAVFANVDVKESRARIIHRDFDAAVRAIDVHPSMTKIAIGGKSGYLKIWNYHTKLTECSRHIEGKSSSAAIRCIKFDPSGEFLAVGHEGGVLRILDADTLSDVMEENFHYSRECITHIVFSDDSRYLATADKEFTTSLYQREPGHPWTYVGRHRAHYKEIHDLLFGVQIDTGYNRLLSLGKDRYLVEYDIPNASKDNLPVLTSDRIEQNGVPLCMTWYPPIVKEQFLLTANDEYKYKLYNCTTKKCRNTFLGPTYGSPVRKLCILPRPNALPTDRRYVVYMLNDKIGLTILPLDGNPHNSVGCVAHPQGVANLACSADGRFLFTAGGDDATVQMWSVHTAVLDAQSKLGGPDLIPFYSLMDGGRDGELFKELEDYFYYAQLRAQGIDSMETRRVSERIPISEIPFVMRGLGFYPSEQEIDNMMNEIQFSRYVDTGEYVTDIDLGEFIRLYVNHRPVFGLSLDRIFKAFQVLGQAKGDDFLVDRGEILDLLQNSGEHMTEYELAEYLTTLLGFNPEGGSFELEEFNPATAGDLIESHIPSSLGAAGFVEDLLGFGPVTAHRQSSKAAASRSESARPKSVQISSSEVQTL